MVKRIINDSVTVFRAISTSTVYDYSFNFVDRYDIICLDYRSQIMMLDDAFSQNLITSSKVAQNIFVDFKHALLMILSINFN